MGLDNLPPGVTPAMIDAQFETDCVECALPTDLRCDGCAKPICDRESCERAHEIDTRHDVLEPR